MAKRKRPKKNLAASRLTDERHLVISARSTQEQPDPTASFPDEQRMDFPEFDKLTTPLNERYEIKDLVARQPDDWLYYAVYRATGWPVTIQFTHQAEAFDRACRWQELDASSPCVERITESGKLDSGISYIVSEISAKPHLLLLADAPKVSQKQAVSLIRQLCDTASQLHKLGLVHGEIDPSSVVYTHQGNQAVLHALRRPFYRNLLGLKLADSENQEAVWKGQESDWVELQAAAYQASWISSKRFSRFTEGLLHSVPLSGWMAACLNPFAAPEAALDRAGPAADVYSLGALLYWLLAGEPHINLTDILDRYSLPQLLPDNVDRQQILKLLLEPMYMVKLMGAMDFNEKIPVELRGIIANALRGAVEDRLPNPAALGEELERIKLLDIVVCVTSGGPVPGAEVSLTKVDNGETQAGLTNRKGEIVFDELFSGAYRVEAAHKNYLPVDPHTISVPLRTADKKVELQLERVGFFSRFFDTGKK